MRLNLFISIFFIIATTFTALHEIKHLQNHNGSSCQICIADDHSISADIIDEFKEIYFFSFDEISSPTTVCIFDNKKHYHKTRAPPKNS